MLGIYINSYNLALTSSSLLEEMLSIPTHGYSETFGQAACLVLYIYNDSESY
jgi:hypothetical protein